MEQESFRQLVLFVFLIICFLINEYNYSCNNLDLQYHHEWSNRSKKEIQLSIEENKKGRVFFVSAIFFHICLSL